MGINKQIAISEEKNKKSRRRWMPSRSQLRSIGRRPPSTTTKPDAHHARSPYPKTKKRKGRPLLAPPSATLEHKNEQKHRSASIRSFFFTRPELAETTKKQTKNIHHRFY